MRYLLGLFFLLSFRVYADFYSWQPYGMQTTYPDPVAACTALIGVGTPSTWTYRGLHANSAVTVKYCVYDRPDISGGDPAYPDGYWSFANLNVTRRGDRCPDGTVYDPETGECKGDPCQSTIGQRTVHEHLRGPIGGPVIEPPLTICENACQYAFTFNVLDVYRFVNPNSDQLDNSYGKYEYQGNGTSCTESDDPQNGSVFDQPPSQPPMDKTPEYSRENTCDQWVTNPDGTRTRSCTAKEEFKQPGTIECIGGWSSPNCKPGKPSPEYSKTETNETTTETTNPDGSKKTDTSKTTDKTECKGVKPCTSTSKTETGTSETDADGKPGNESGNCTGNGCKPGDQDGDGDKEQEGEEEGEEEERTATVGACDAPVSCSGDAIDCAVLQQQHEHRCLAEEMSDFSGNKSEIESLFEGDKFKLQEGEGDIEVPSLIRQGTRFLPASCPQDKTFNLSTAGGRTFGLSFEPLCQAATDLSGLFVAVATILAALYVGRSVGGN